MKPTGFHAIGKNFPRKDGIAKVRGYEKYASDISLPHMLHARVLRSPYPHAKIVRIDTSAAERVGVICLTFNDIPKVRYNERTLDVPEKRFKDRYVLADKGRHVGEAIAAVAAETEFLAERALELIEIEYEKLPFVLDPLEAMKPRVAPIYDSILVGEEETPIENNIACTREIVEGDIEKGFAEAHIIVEEEYRTPGVYHAQLETKSVVCRPEPDGGLTVWATTQSIHNVRHLLGDIFKLSLNKVNIKRVPIGGAFGSSIQMNAVIPICVALALKSRRPVKLVSTREEDMYDHRKYPSIIRLKLGAKRDGTLVAGEMKAILDIGAHNIQAFNVMGCMAGWWVSLYRLPHLKFQGTAVYTNKVPTCAMQGFGNPQVTFVVESMMDVIAERLGIDPIELRLENYIGLGETFWGQGPTVRSIIKSCGVEDLLQHGSEMIGWDNRPRPKSQSGRIRRGIGVARGFHTSGTGAPQPGDIVDYSSALVKINEDGSADVVTALMDLGGGSADALAKIVAEELGIPLDKVGISPSDTLTTTYDVATHASRGVYCGGGAAQKAAKQAKQKLLGYAARILDVTSEALKIRPDSCLGGGVIYAEAIPGRCITVGEVAKIAQVRSWGAIAAVASLRQVNCPPTFTVVFIEVEGDMETGQVKVKRAVLGADAGVVINPDLAAGQLEGGLSKGLGYALLEDTIYDPQSGALANNGYICDCKIATACDMPLVDDIRTFFVETVEPTGPFGAKGLGEAALNPVAAAVANAIYNATGFGFRELPITQEKILRAIKEAAKAEIKEVCRDEQH